MSQPWPSSSQSYPTSLRPPPGAQYPPWLRPNLGGPPPPQIPFRALTHQRPHKPQRLYFVGQVLNVALHQRVGDNVDPSDYQYISTDKWNRWVMSKPRKCIVVEKHRLSVLVAPITTYGAQGVGKRGVDASVHAIVYSDVTQNRYLPAENEKARDMLQGSIRIIPATLGINLLPGSRIDFSKVETIEKYHEVEVFGEVAEECLHILREHHVNTRAQGCSRRAFLPLPYEVSPGIHKRILKIDGTGFMEERDPAFRIQDFPDHFFQVGTVFQVLSWREEPDEDESDITHHVLWTTSAEAPILRRILYLIVIEVGQKFCHCLRILSYYGRGARNLPKGLTLSDHSVAYTDDQEPELHPDEKPTRDGACQLGFPICIRPGNREDVLLPTARICWARIYQVEKELKVKPFGRVARHCEHTFIQQFKRRNPESSIEIKRPMARYRRSNKEFEGQHLERRIGMYDKAIHHVLSSSSSSSSLHGERKQCAQNPPAFEIGDNVILLTASDGPGTIPRLQGLQIRSARAIFEDGEYVWEYNLGFQTHNGLFAGHTFFREKLLMPA